MGCGCGKRLRQVAPKVGYKQEGDEWVNLKTGHRFNDAEIEDHHIEIAIDAIAYKAKQYIAKEQ